MRELYKQALEDLHMARVIYDESDIECEDVAYHELKAAESRLIAILKTIKEDERCQTDVSQHESEVVAYYLEKIARIVDFIKQRSSTRKIGKMQSKD